MEDLSWIFLVLAVAFVLLWCCGVQILKVLGWDKYPKSTAPGNPSLGNIVAGIDRDLRAPDQYIMRL